MDLMTLTEIRRAAQNGGVPARVHVQVEGAAPKLTREQQPYCELTLADACDRMTLRARQEADWDLIAQRIQAILDPRLRALCEAFLKEWGDRFRRTAAARNYHHARRGGLVEHTAQMMRISREIAPLYPQLNADLLLAGILFHDCGKLWENQMPENGFNMSYDERGE